MAHTIYDFLRDSVLTHPDHLADGYLRIRTDELEAELLRYREYVRKHWPSILEELSKAGKLRTYFDSFEETIPSEESIRRAALYFDLLVLPDPLYRAAEPPDRLASDHDRLLGTASNQWPHRQEVVKAVTFLNLVRPLVAGQAAKVVPVSLLYERGEHIPMLFSDTGFYELVPPPALQIFRAWSEVWPLRKVDAGWISGGDIPDAPCRAISIRYRHHLFSMMYTLLESKVVSFDRDAGLATLASTMPDTPPSKERFDLWVDEAINRTAWVALERIAAGGSIATRAGAFISTTSPLVHEVLKASKNSDEQEDMATGTASVAMRLSLPVLDGLSLAQVMQLRECHGESFDSYRTTVRQGLRRVASMQEGATARALRDLELELIDCRLPEVERSVRHLRRSRLRNVAVKAVGIALSLPPLWHSPQLAATAAGTAAIMTGAQYLSTWGDHNDSLSKLPAHFLWEAGKLSKKGGR